MSNRMARSFASPCIMNELQWQHASVHATSTQATKFLPIPTVLNTQNGARTRTENANTSRSAIGTRGANPPPPHYQVETQSPLLRVGTQAPLYHQEPCERLDGEELAPNYPIHPPSRVAANGPPATRPDAPKQFRRATTGSSAAYSPPATAAVENLPPVVPEEARPPHRQSQDRKRAAEPVEPPRSKRAAPDPKKDAASVKKSLDKITMALNNATAQATVLRAPEPFHDWQTHDQTLFRKLDELNDHVRK